MTDVSRGSVAPDIIALGVPVFPCLPNKRPLQAGWQDHATADPDQIAAWVAAGTNAFGIPCGPASGAFVVDLDVCKDTGAKLGEASLASSPAFARFLDLPYVTTPSGGRHIYFQHFDGGRNTTSKIAPCVDTRGAGGYVLAPGSITQGGRYIGSIPTELPAVPLSLRAVFAARVPTTRTKTLLPASQTPTGEVEELLRFIPPDGDYGTWLSVLMALHDRYGGSNEGLLIADDWSAQGGKYKLGEVASKWAGFKGTGVSWATIPALARQNGANLSEIARVHHDNA